MNSNHEAWLALTKEEPIDPGLPICDAHHHLWDHPDERYLCEEFMRDAATGHNVIGSVFVECKSMYRTDGPTEMRPVGETQYVRSATDRTKVAAGIVAFADLTLGTAAEKVLVQQVSEGGGRVRGIRYSTAWDASGVIRSSTDRPGVLLEPKFRQGFSRLSEHQLSFDAWVYHTQLGEVLDLARAFPGTTIVLNHAGGLLGIGPYANSRREVFQTWKRGMASLKTCPNVFVKLGGLGSPRTGFDWHLGTSPPTSVELAEALAPYFRFCIEQFGMDRCMFESNFPVDRMAYSYTVLWNAFKRITVDCADGEKHALFHDTARKVYRLAS